jgi:polyhydroxybutyrate depolymerase
MFRLGLGLFIVAACGAGGGGGGGGGGDTDAGTDAHNPPGTRPTMFGGSRPTTLRAPTTLEDGKLYPLVLSLHGYGSNGDITSAYFGLRTLPVEGKALLLSPDGTKDSTGTLFWDADPECCDWEGRNPDDVGYLGKLIDDVIAAWPVDRNAVYVVGHSNGAFMAYRLGCARADIVRGIAGLAGGAASTPASCMPSQPIDVLHVHGTGDMVIPYSGSGLGPGAVASVTQWAAHNSCGATRSSGAPLDLESSLGGNETTTESTVGCPAHGAVDLWSIQGGSHVPGSGARIGQRMIQWFEAHKGS